MALLAEQFSEDYVQYMTPDADHVPPAVLNLPLPRAIVIVLMHLHIRKQMHLSRVGGASIPQIAAALHTSGTSVARAIFRELDPLRYVISHEDGTVPATPTAIASPAGGASPYEDETDSALSSTETLDTDSHSKSSEEDSTPTGLSPGAVGGRLPDPAWSINVDNPEIMRTLDVYATIRETETGRSDIGRFLPMHYATKHAFILINTEWSRSCIFDVLREMEKIETTYPTYPLRVHVTGFVMGRHYRIFQQEASGPRRDRQLKHPLQPIHLVKTALDSRDALDELMCIRATMIATQYPCSDIFLVSQSAGISKFKNVASGEFSRGSITHVFNPSPFAILKRFLFDEIYKELNPAGAATPADTRQMADKSSTSEKKRKPTSKTPRLRYMERSWKKGRHSKAAHKPNPHAGTIGQPARVRS